MQQHLFSHHSQIHYFGKYDTTEMLEAVRPALLATEVNTWNPPADDIYAKPLPEQLRYAAENGLRPVLSKEGLSGGPLERRQRQARLFKEHFDNCKIILVVREPVSLVKSWYAEMLKAFQTRSWVENRGWAGKLPQPPHYFDANTWIHLCWKLRCSPKNFISYADTAATYADVFGKENVHLLLFEEFVQNPAGFITRLCSSMEIDSDEGVQLTHGKRSNNRISTAYVERLKELEQSELLTGQFRQADLQTQLEMLNPNDQSTEKIIPEFSRQWLRKINSTGTRQNRRLVKEWNLPLAVYGNRV